MLHKCVYNVKIQMYIERKFYITYIQYYDPEIITDYIFYIFLVLFRGISGDHAVYTIFCTVLLVSNHETHDNSS